MDNALGMIFAIILVVVTLWFFVWVGRVTQSTDSNVETKDYRFDFLNALEAYVADVSNPNLESNLVETAKLFTVFIQLNTGDLAERTERKRDAYAEILSLLQRYPKIPLLHTMALDFGRFSYAVGRPNQQLTIYDENAIANDIRAVAGASYSATSEPEMRTPAQATPTNTIAYRLKALTELRDAGVITEEEYAAQRKAIVESI
jgi:hypothetical protein